MKRAALAALAICAALAQPAWAVSPFGGKFELVPLFDAGHRPVVRNGHTYYAERNTITFHTDEGDTLTVFAGERTDLASIPRIVWPFLPPDGAYAEAAAFHDACYRTRGTFGFFDRRGMAWDLPYDRAGCDEVLRQAMVALGVPTLPRVTIWAAVRLFGGAGWGN